LRSAASSALTGPLPSAAVWSDLAVDLDLDRRLGEELAAGALLDEHVLVDDAERCRVVGLVAGDQQLDDASAPSTLRPSDSRRLTSAPQLAWIDRRPSSWCPSARRGSRCWPGRRAPETTSRPGIATAAGSMCW
jgi:hypothetical protein